MDKISEFMGIYKPLLADNMLKHPETFWIHDADAVAGKLETALREKGIRAININTNTFKATAKHFKIANTYIAWEAWFKSA